MCICISRVNDPICMLVLSLITSNVSTTRRLRQIMPANRFFFFFFFFWSCCWFIITGKADTLGEKHGEPDPIHQLTESQPIALCGMYFRLTRSEKAHTDINMQKNMQTPEKPVYQTRDFLQWGNNAKHKPLFWHSRLNILEKKLVN